MTDVTIRPAVFEDAAFLARMNLLTAEGLSEHMWRWMGGPDCDPMLYGPARVESADTAISWTKGWIAERHDQPVGALLCDLLTAEPTPILPGEDPAYVAMQELENLAPETATILILAVEPASSRQGIGARLLDFADRFAGPKGMSATVSDANDGGRRLLARGGYQLAGGMALPARFQSVAFIAPAGPQSRGLGLACSGGQHCDWGIVCKYGLARQHMPPDRVSQRLQQGGRFAHPIRQGRAIQIKPFAAEDLALAIQRQVVGILVDQNLGEKTRIPLPDRRMPAFAEKGAARAR